MTGEDSLESLLRSSDTQPSAKCLVVCSVFEDERPLKGTAGALDWRFRGFLSRFMLSGKISGAKNEFVYIPMRHQGATRHLMLVGLGSRNTLPKNQNDTQASALLTALATRISSLGFKNVVISQSSFPFLEESKIKKAFKGVTVELTQ